MNFDQWWNEDYDDKDNPFEKDSFGYWAYAGWCAALAQPEQEKTCVSCGKPTMHVGDKCYGCCQTAQPVQEPWVSLTDEEIAEAVGSPIDEVYLVDFCKVEAALRKKNDPTSN